MADWLNSETMAYAGLALLAILALGFVIGRLGGRRSGDPRHESEARLESQLRDRNRTIARLRSEQRAVSNLARALPHVVRELNRVDLDPDSVPNLMMQLVDAIFEPEQVLIFLVRSPGETQAARELHLKIHHGLNEVPDVLRTVKVGQGKIGWVGAHNVVMAAEDWLNLTRTEGRSVPDPHPAAKLDYIAPIVHYSGMQIQLLGVVCVGRPTVRPRDERMMLQLITDLGALAFLNVRNMRRLADRAHHDGLTGLLNKKSFLERAGLMIHKAEHRSEPVGLFIFDIDHFKAYNDQNGHLAGDELLKKMASLIKENLRPGDLAGRYGGEEFVVAMPECDAESTMRAAERLRATIAGYHFPHGENQPNGVLSISGGVAAFPLDGTNGTELINHADHALYQAKAAGRNRVMRYRSVDIGGAHDEDDLPYPDAAGS